MKTRVIVVGMFGLVLAAVFSARAQLVLPEPEPIVGARMPALSPDGQRLAFVYRGDIWSVSSGGGRARPVTQHVEIDSYPIFSPDGQWIAFASKRAGGWDIYAIPADGGPARRLTYESGSELPCGWSPDGKRILFSSKRDSVNYGIFSVDVVTLQDELLGEDFARLNFPSYSPDGRTVVYGRYGFHWSRPRYVGSAASQLCLLDVETGERQLLTRTDRQHLWPQFLPDGKHLVAVTIGEETPSTSRLGESIGKVEDSAQRTPNLWRFDLYGYGAPLTHFVGGSVRWPSVATASGDIAFEYGADIWLLPKQSSEPQPVRLFASADAKQTAQRRETLKSGVEEAEPSLDGKTFAFGLKGEIWTVAIDKPSGLDRERAEIARRLTDWAGDDSDFSWSKDGRKLYFTSDREFNTRIFVVELETLKVEPLWERSEDVTGLRLSPDGESLAFWVSGDEGGLHTLSLRDGTLRRIVRVPGPQWRGMGGGSYAWSPDMRWIAYTHSGESGAWNIWIVPVEGGESVNATQLYAHHSLPTWSPDGRFLFFYSDRDGPGLYALPLTEEPIRSSDTEIRFEKAPETVRVEIDFEDMGRRIRKLGSQRPTSDLIITAGGDILFISSGDIWSVSYDGKQTRRLSNGGGKFQLRLSGDGRRLFFVQKGELWRMNVDGKNPAQITFTAEWEREVDAERRAAFTQFWRSYHRGFYDPNFHGRDWESIRRTYEPMLQAVGTDEEFATVLQMMVGELEASHSEIKPNRDTDAAPATPHLGFTIDYSHPGPGLRVKGVPPGAPGSYEKTRLQPGEYVLKINGEMVGPTEHLYEQINGQAGRLAEFEVSTTAQGGESRSIQFKLLSESEWKDLNYDNWVVGLRKYVENKSGGRIGYLHIPAMGRDNQTQFEREAYEYIVGKDAMIIDVRFNTGGNIADTLIDWLERKPHGYVRPRDAEPVPSPYRAWVKPIIVLMNEHSYSNAEIFPYAMRARKLAQLVGMPTPGYVIWTDSLQLVDGTGARMPQSGFYRLDGTTQENNGEKPDVLVPLLPEDWLAGRDPQVDRAIELLQKPVAVNRPPGY